MKKIFLLMTVWAFVTATAFSQDRTDTTPEILSGKSKEITKALFWNKNSKTGKWVSVKNNARPYLGEGVHSDNFNTLFIGEYKEHKYLFIDFFNGQWRYPNLELEWMYFRHILAGLLSDEQYDCLKNIKSGETYSVISKFSNEMFKGSDDYSPSFFLSLTETLRSANEITEETKPIYLITVKRTVSGGNDVIRFILYPHAISELIDFNYFEVTYDEYNKLFTPDKNTKFK